MQVIICLWKSREHFSKTTYSTHINVCCYKNEYGAYFKCLLDLYNLKSRFVFTVYGPYGRPDMAYYKFCNLINKNNKIKVFNKGKHKRSFTFIDDAVNNLFLILKNAKKINTIKSPVLNIGNPKTRTLTEFINILEKKLFKKSKKKLLKRQPGDVLETKAIINFERKKLKFFFNTELEEGIEKFVKWHNSYH